MSFADNPPEKFVSWKPNSSFTKFFQDMKKRRIPANDSPIMRVTNTSPPSGSSSGPKQTEKQIKVNYTSPSEVITNTALSQTGRYKRRKQTAPKVRRKKAAKGSKAQKKTSGIERKIRKHKF